MLSRDRYRWVLPISLLVSLLLSVVPLPGSLSFWQPAWVWLVIVYWILNAPNRFSLLLAWGVGLLQDLLQGNVLGLHALVYVLVMYVLLRFTDRFKLFHPLFQWMCILILLLVTISVEAWILICTDALRFTPKLWLPVITTALVWPLVTAVLEQCEHK